MIKLEKFMEGYNANTIYNAFVQATTYLTKKVYTPAELTSEIKDIISVYSGTAKEDLIKLFTGWLETQPFFSRKSENVIEKLITESNKKDIVFAYGRFNPPTIGHQLLIDNLIKEAKKLHAAPILYLSLTVDTDKNPLSPKDKKKYIESVYKNLDVRIDAKNAFDVMDKLSSEGNIGHVTLLTGADQLAGYKKISKYVESGEYKIDSFEAKSIGERNDDSDGLDGVSASKVRKMIKDGEDVSKVLLKGLSDKYIKEIVSKIK